MTTQELLLRRVNANNPKLTRVGGLGHLEGEQVEELANALLHNTVVRCLDLTGNRVGERGAVALGRVICYNNAIRYINLEGNQIGNVGAEALSNGLRKNKSVAHLNLFGNGIGARGAKAIADAISCNHKIASVNLSQNDIGDSGAEALASALSSTDSLVDLYLSGNGIGNRGGTALARSLCRNDTLTGLDLTANRIGREGASAFARSILLNPPRVWRLHLRRLASAPQARCHEKVRQLELINSLTGISLWENEAADLTPLLGAINEAGLQRVVEGIHSAGIAALPLALQRVGATIGAAGLFEVILFKPDVFRDARQPATQLHLGLP